MIELDLHVGWFILGGIALLAMTTLPRLFDQRPLSLPMLYVAVGYAAFEFLPPLIGPDPVMSSTDSKVIEYATELIVIVSLAGAGLKLDRQLGLVSWGSVWRLLSIAMLLTVGAAVVFGYFALGLGLGAAVLLGAVLAPTDPVLADDVQVDEPGADHESEVRFTLTAEAGLNDGLAFPIASLAVAVAAGGSFASVAGEWVATDVAYRIVVGIVVGVVLGRALVRFGRWSGELTGEQPMAGLFILGATITVYGLAELVNGYGFLAVFVGALSHSRSDLRTQVSAFADQLERILLAFVLIGFGALLSEGVLDALTWRGAMIAIVLVVVVRPVAGYLSLVGGPLPRSERLAVAFFGIRGMGSLYYLAWAVNHGDFPGDDVGTVWAVTSFAVVVSIVVHGVTAGPVMRWVDSRCPPGAAPDPHPDTADPDTTHLEQETA